MIDPKMCALCGEANACAMAAGSEEPCWCADVAIDQTVIQRIPEAARSAACVCRVCAGGPGAAE